MAGAEKTKSNTVEGLLQEFRKDSGEDVGAFGGEYENAPRLPTGIFPLDLALGGGFPMGRTHIVWGPESSCKTNIVLMAIAMHQRLFPHLLCVFFDAEHSWDAVWAAKLGVDVGRVVVMRPKYAEELVDQIEALMYADNVGVVALDSVAALVTTQEASSSAEKANVGGSGLVVGKLCRKVTSAQSEVEKLGRRPTFFMINQIRFKIGVMFGDPETMPGGNAPKFAANMSLRVYGKNIKDPKISAEMPISKEVSFVLKKWKCPVISAGGKFEMVMVPHKGLSPGDTADFETIAEFLKEAGQFGPVEKGKGYLILNEPYPTISAFKERIYKDKAYGDEVRQAIITYICDENGIEVIPYDQSLPQAEA